MLANSPTPRIGGVVALRHSSLVPGPASRTPLREAGSVHEPVPEPPGGRYQSDCAVGAVTASEAPPCVRPPRYPIFLARAGTPPACGRWCVPNGFARGQIPSERVQSPGLAKVGDFRHLVGRQHDACWLQAAVHDPRSGRSGRRGPTSIPPAQHAGRRPKDNPRIPIRGSLTSADGGRIPATSRTILRPRSSPYSGGSGRSMVCTSIRRN